MKSPARALRLRIWILACALLLGALARAEDWPTYLKDQARSGRAQEALAPPLALQWVYTAGHPPQPAWSDTPDRPLEGKTLLNRVAFDEAFQTAVAGETLFFGSSSDYKVYALDAKTGKERWAFCTGGPVRLAPTVWEGRVYVGSDDGCAYCLDAKDGRLIWRLRAGPRDERILGNGHMISRWPVRTGVLVDGGAAYFGAGVFPHEGLYVCAASAEDGKVLWKNETMGLTDAGQIDFSPQGYLLASDSMIFVPSGRGMPAAFSRADGQWVYQPRFGWRTEEAGGVVGGVYALLADGQVYTGTHELVGVDQTSGKAGFAWFPGRRLVVADDRAYLATGSEIAALNRQAYAEASRRFPKDYAASFKIKKSMKTAQANLKQREKEADSARTQLSKAKSEMERLAEAQKAEAEGAALQSRCEQCEQALAKAQEALTAAQQHYDELARQSEELKTGKQEHQEQQVEPAILWRVPCAYDAALILGGDLVIAGGEGEVAAFDAQSGVQAWSAKVEGKASGLAAANGGLFVSTDKGKIYRFAPAAKAPGTPAELSPETQTDPYPKDDLTAVYAAAAQSIVKESGATKGFCLVLGCESGRLAYELARRTELKIYGIEPDAKKVEQARRALGAAGLYGARVCVEQGDPASPPYSNCFANLVVSESALLRGELPAEAANAARCVKPCGGAICLGLPENAPVKAKEQLTADRLRQWLAKAAVGECAVSQEGGLWATARRGALPGAGKWTHQYAEPGNTACSDDQRVRGPLRLLWYGEPGSTRMVNRHDKAAAPLAIGGRLFVQGEGTVFAYDAYNGVLLWQRDIPQAVRKEQNSEAGNLAASDDSLFIAAGTQCLRLDAATGETRSTYDMPAAPDGGPRRWGYMACVDGKIFGSAIGVAQDAPIDAVAGESDMLFAFDVQSGKSLWTYAGKHIMDLTIAIGDGRVFLIDSSISEPQRQGLLKQDKTKLKKLKGAQAQEAETQLRKTDTRMAVALDAATGKKIWDKAVDVTNCSRVGTSGGELAAAYHDGVLALYGACADGHMWKQFLAGEFSQRRIVALSAEDGSVLWAKDANYRHRPLIVGQTIVAEPWGFDLHTGAQKTRPHPLTGAEAPWQFLRPGHHCGAVSASPNMLFFRSGFTGYYDLEADAGAMHFGAHRLGCWINAVPANGLLLAPEASAGCVCLWSVVCSVALEPCQEQKGWGIYSASGPNKPVQTLAVSLGAPGDRRDKDGTLWLAFPRPKAPALNAALELKLEIEPEFDESGAYYCCNSETTNVEGTDHPWVYASGARGLKRCVVPLLDEGSEPGRYTVRLHFAEIEEAKPGQRLFDVQLQGQVVDKGLDIAQEAGVARKALVREFKNIEVADNLVIELAAAGQGAGAQADPILSGIEVVREGKSGAKASAAPASKPASRQARRPPTGAAK